MSDTPIVPPVPGLLPETEKHMFDLQSNQGQLAALAGSPRRRRAGLPTSPATPPQSRLVTVEARASTICAGAIRPARHSAGSWQCRACLLVELHRAVPGARLSMSRRWICRAWATATGARRTAMRAAIPWSCSPREQMAVCEDAGMFEGAEPPVIVAHSFGGFVTMLTGGLYGDRLKGVVILDSPVNPPRAGRGGGPPECDAASAQYLSQPGGGAGALPPDAAADRATICSCWTGWRGIR